MRRLDMDVYDYAMQMEKDGESYYRSAALRVNHKGLRSILTMLADSEVAHYYLFKQMKDDEKVSLKDSTILADVKNVFQQIAESKDFSLIELSTVELYKTAQDIEQKSIKLYEEQASRAGEGQIKEAFLKVADEEKKHYLILEKLVDFVSQPDTWLENPEWYHLEEY
jgi:rubrerythrin